MKMKSESKKGNKVSSKKQAKTKEPKKPKVGLYMHSSFKSYCMLVSFHFPPLKLTPANTIHPSPPLR